MFSIYLRNNKTEKNTFAYRILLRNNVEVDVKILHRNLNHRIYDFINFCLQIYQADVLNFFAVYYFGQDNEIDCPGVNFIETNIFKL